MSNFKKILTTLNEMSPRNIKPLDTNKHQIEAQKYWDDHKNKFRTTTTKYLYKSGDDYNGYYMLVVDDIVEYFVKYEDVHRIINKKVVLKQALVHRHISSAWSASIPKEVFFNYLLPTYGGIITDSEQTSDGRRFWEGAVIEAINKKEKYDVYILNRNTKEYNKIESREDFANNVHKIWGDDKIFEHIAVVIFEKIN